MLSLIFSVVTLGKDYFFLLFSATVVWSGVRKGKQKARAAEPRVAAGQARAWTLPGPVPQLLNGPSGAGDGQGQPQHCGCTVGAEAAPWPSCVSGMAKDTARPRPRPSCYPAQARARARAEVQAPGMWRRPSCSSVTHGSVPAARAGLARITPQSWPWVWAAKAPLGMYVCACGPPRR